LSFVRCHYHRDVEAVASCKNCSRGLCDACAVDVGNGLACRNRCEGEVRALNEMIERNKAAYTKTSGAYVRTAGFYGVLAAMLFIAAAVDWRGLRWMLVPAGAVCAFAGYLHYSTGRKFVQR
jgi:hypothetical protein